MSKKGHMTSCNLIMSLFVFQVRRRFITNFDHKSMNEECPRLRFGLSFLCGQRLAQMKAKKDPKKPDFQKKCQIKANKASNNHCLY